MPLFFFLSLSLSSLFQPLSPLFHLVVLCFLFLFPKIEKFKIEINQKKTVHLDGAQFSWLESQIAEAELESKPVIVFTHAPPAGCGLRVVQAVHVRNRCAYLNHGALDREGEEEGGKEEGGGGGRRSSSSSPASSSPPPPPPEAFVRLVERHQNVRLWFSGHYHLSHNYSSSVSVVNRCAFAQVGVIGPRSTRDGLRQSRVLDGDARGFQLFTLDHETGQMRLDARGEWGEEGGGKGKGKELVEVLPLAADQLLDAAADASWLCSQVDCGVGSSSAASLPLFGEEEEEELEASSDADAPSSPWPAPAAFARSAEKTQWLPAGGDALLALSQSGGDVLEYSARMRCPVGFVLDKLPVERGELRARLVDAEGREVFPNFASSSSSSSSSAGGGGGDEGEAAACANAAAVEVLVAATGEVVGRRRRNSKGSFYHVYQPNKWRKKVAELEREARETSGVAAAAV